MRLNGWAQILSSPDIQLFELCLFFMSLELIFQTGMNTSIL